MKSRMSALRMITSEDIILDGDQISIPGFSRTVENFNDDRARREAERHYSLIAKKLAQPVIAFAAEQEGRIRAYEARELARLDEEIKQSPVIGLLKKAWSCLSVPRLSIGVSYGLSNFDSIPAGAEVSLFLEGGEAVSELKITTSPAGQEGAQDSLRYMFIERRPEFLVPQKHGTCIEDGEIHSMDELQSVMSKWMEKAWDAADIPKVQHLSTPTAGRGTEIALDTV